MLFGTCITLKAEVSSVTADWKLYTCLWWICLNPLSHNGLATKRSTYKEYAYEDIVHSGVLSKVKHSLNTSMSTAYFDYVQSQWK